MGDPSEIRYSVSVVNFTGQAGRIKMNTEHRTSNFQRRIEGCETHKSEGKKVRR